MGIGKCLRRTCTRREVCVCNEDVALEFVMFESARDRTLSREFFRAALRCRIVLSSMVLW